MDAGGTPLENYLLTKAWPTTLEITHLKPGDSEVVIESTTLTGDSLYSVR